MKTKFHVTIIATGLAILLLTVPAVWARIIRVKFPPGRTTVVLNGKTTGGPSENGGMDPITYKLRARKGQQMTLHLTSAKKNALFGVYQPGMDLLEGAQSVTDWTGPLPKSGDYEIMVFPNDETHFPVNSHMLYVDADRLPPETLAEMKRLGPDGNTSDSRVQVYLVGPISERVKQEVRDKLGYKTRAFRIDDPFAHLEELDTWGADVHTDHPDEVVVVQCNQLATGLPGAAWNAQMGHRLFFVQGDTIPDATKRTALASISRRSE